MNTFQILIVSVMLAGGTVVLGQVENATVETTTIVPVTSEVPAGPTTESSNGTTLSVEVTTVSINQTSSSNLEVTTSGNTVDGASTIMANNNATTTIPAIDANVSSSTPGDVGITTPSTLNVTTSLPNITSTIPSVSDSGSPNTTTHENITTTVLPPKKTHKLPPTSINPLLIHDGPSTPKTPPPTPVDPAGVPSPVLFKFPKINIDIPTFHINQKKE